MTIDAAEPNYFLADVLSAPFPSHLCAAPNGSQVAWTFNDRGSRNIWIGNAASSDGAEARALTTYSGDDGMALGGLRWTPGGDAVVYARGGRLADGASPNAGSVAQGGEESAIWLIAVDGSLPRRLGPGSAPEISPKGDRVAYLAPGQIWTAGLGGAEVAAEQLVQDRGQPECLTWAPDGDRLAFVSNRRDHACVGVYDFRSGTLDWLAPGFGVDGYPSWSPDGGRIAFIRLAGSTRPTYTANRSGPPWSILVADVATGVSHVAWTAKPGAGSVFSPMETGPQLLWNAGGLIVFPWERTGWRHLYTLETGSRRAEDLTPGAFEVFGAAYDARTDTIIYATNRDTIDQRHLWRTSLSTRRNTPLTTGQTIEDCPVIAGSGHIVALQAASDRPLLPVRIEQDGQSTPLARDVVPACFPAGRMIAPELVTLEAPDAVRLQAWLFVPPQRTHGHAHPAIVHFHGGPARQMLCAWHPMEPYSLQYGMNQYLASRGYLVLSVNYRGGTGYGLDFREPIGFGAGGASEFQDVLASALYLSSRPDVDPQRIGAYGLSYGGLMTGLALARASDLYAAGVDHAGVSDWSAAFSGADVPSGIRELAARSSPAATIDQWKSPVLFGHADDDDVVPFSQTLDIVRALRRKGGVHVEHMMFPNETHDFLRRCSWTALLESTAGFLDRMLRPNAGQVPGDASEQIESATCHERQDDCAT